MKFYLYVYAYVLLYSVVIIAICFTIFVVVISFICLLLLNIYMVWYSIFSYITLHHYPLTHLSIYTFIQLYTVCIFICICICICICTRICICICICICIYIHGSITWIRILLMNPHLSTMSSCWNHQSMAPRGNDGTLSVTSEACVPEPCPVRLPSFANLKMAICSWFPHEKRGCSIFFACLQ